MAIRVSVIIPSLDPGKCIKKCISSVKAQTLKGVEIICCDAGSTDGTAEFLSDAAARDQDIRVLNFPGASFGALANAGIEAARGRYVMVMRPGDWAEPDMLKTLFESASGMDIVMAGFYDTPAPSEKEVLRSLPARYTAINEFDPLLTFDTALDQSEIFKVNCAVGSAIISREFLINNSIYYTEINTPLYHDISFSFKVWALASHVKLLNSAFLHCGWRGGYASDGSACRDAAQAVMGEYDEIRYFIREVFSEDRTRMKVLLSIMIRLKYDSYLSCCHILPSSLRKDFIKEASREFEDDTERGYADRKYFPSFDWNTFYTWTYDPLAFAEMIEQSRKPSLLARIRKNFKKK